MRCDCAVLAILILFNARLPVAAFARPEALEIGPGNTKDLPGGREADGIIGDFVLRNDRIEAVISGNQHNRKANMGTNWNAPTPGCLYDLTLRGTNNDQITCLSPGSQEGQLSDVRIIRDGRDGEAIVRAELSAPAGRGLAKTHDYILRDGWAYVKVISTYCNQGNKPVTIKPQLAVRGLERGMGDEKISAGDGPDPACKQSYAFAGAPDEGLSAFAKEVVLQPGDEKRYGVVLSVGTSPAAAYGELAALRDKTGRLKIRLREADGAPVSAANVFLPLCGGTLVAFPDNEGRIDILVPLGKHAVRAEDIGRPTVTADAEVNEQGTAIEIEMAPASRIGFDVRSEQGRGLPCKVQFIGRDGTPDPDFGPIVRAHGCSNQYHSENGRFAQPVPPGKYHVVITHGIEFDHAERDIDVPPGKTVEVKATLCRIVDTSGWVSCDFHNHTTVSGDNYCGTPDRIINLAAEQIEFAPTTEHNRFFDWTPFIAALHLTDELVTVPGIELTGSGPHLNSFPQTVRPFTQDNGAPQWHPDPRINALALRGMPDADDRRWVQLNHPDMIRYFNDRNGDGKADGGFVGLESMIDGCEIMGSNMLSGDPNDEYVFGDPKNRTGNRAFLWLQMLNAGRVLRPVVVSDAHEVTQGGVGGWRTYVPCAAEELAKIDTHDLMRRARAGHLVVTTGPFLEVKTDDGHSVGETVSATRCVKLKVRVQCNTWADISRVAVLVNGRVPPGLNFTRASHPQMFTNEVVRFDRTIEVPLSSDAHLVVVAAGHGLTLARAYGKSWQKDLPPIAFHNPIFVDVDGNGFKPNGDTLGQPFLQAAQK